MTVGKDWIVEAANEIRESTGDLGNTEVAAIIERHCPFKPETAYMPVPRCETCRHWDTEFTVEDIVVIEAAATAECDLPSMSVVIERFDVLSGKGEITNFQMRTKAWFGCTEWETK